MKLLKNKIFWIVITYIIALLIILGIWVLIIMALLKFVFGG